MSFNFPPLPAAAETRLRRLAPWLLLALGLHAGLALWPRPQRPASRLARLTVADDTPRLLQLSRAQAAAAGGSTALATVPIGLLPPPPPLGVAWSRDEGGAAPAAGENPGGNRQAAAGSRSPGQSRRGAGAAPQAGSGPLPLPTGLPAQAATALAGALTLAGAPPAGAQPSEREALVALQRRQLWLAANQERWLQQLWQRGERPGGSSTGSGTGPGGSASGDEGEAAAAAPPELPDGVELRRLPGSLAPTDLAPLAGTDPHGTSLVGRRQLLLIWRHNGRLWLVRAGLLRSAPGGSAKATGSES